MKVEPAASLVGHLAVPGDKSISHRAVLLGAVSDGETRIDRLRPLGGHGGDGRGGAVARRRRLRVGRRTRCASSAWGSAGSAAPADPIDCGNAGTLMRLLPGLLAGQEGRFVLTGDDSLRSRPMERIAEPLRRMGVRIETTEGRAPLTIEGGAVQPLTYELPVASAQVKSAILLAGLFADGGRDDGGGAAADP